MGNQTSSLDALLERVFPLDEPVATNVAARPGTHKLAPLGILSFQAGGAMNRGLELWEALQPAKLAQLRQSLQMEGIVKLVSADADFRWRLGGVERDKELRRLMSAVVLLGQKSSDPRLQHLRARFDDLLKPGADVSAGDMPPRNVESLLTYLREMVAATSSLHMELDALQSMSGSSTGFRSNKIPKEFLAHNNGSFSALAFGKNGKHMTLQERQQAHYQAQTRTVQRLKATSLWVENADRTVMILVLLVYVLRKRLLEVFGQPHVAPSEVASTLGACGLALHYANIILAINKMIDRPTLVLRNQREELYQKVPRNLQRLMRVRLRGARQPFDPEVAAELRRSLDSVVRWMLPLAQATLVWQREHSFGQQFARRSNLLQVQTLFLANKDAVEVALLELLVGLSYIVRPLGLPALPLGEQAGWKEWVACGGLMEPRSPMATPVRSAEIPSRPPGMASRLSVEEPPPTANITPLEGTAQVTRSRSYHFS